MPGSNQTGPSGNASGSGRGLGPCGGGQRRQGSGVGQGMRRAGFCAGRTNSLVEAVPDAEQRTALTQKAEALEQALADVRKRLDTLNKAK